MSVASKRRQEIGRGSLIDPSLPLSIKLLLAISWSAGFMFLAAAFTALPWWVFGGALGSEGKFYFRAVIAISFFVIPPLALAFFTKILTTKFLPQEPENPEQMDSREKRGDHA